MSFVRANDHSNPDNPQDPLYYAPRSVREQGGPTIQRDAADEIGPLASRSPFVSF